MKTIVNMSNEKVEIVDESLIVESTVRTKRLKSSPGELPSRGLQIKEEIDKKKLEMEKQANEKVKEKVNLGTQQEQMRIYVKAMDGSLSDRTEEIMCDPGVTIGSLVDRFLDICGGVLGSSGYIARDSKGRELGLGNSLSEAEVASLNTVYVYCKSVTTDHKVEL